jgi:hypothetical protein
MISSRATIYIRLMGNPELKPLMVRALIMGDELLYLI